MGDNKGELKEGGNTSTTKDTSFGGDRDRDRDGDGDGDGGEKEFQTALVSNGNRVSRLSDASGLEAAKYHSVDHSNLVVDPDALEISGGDQDFLSTCSREQSTSARGLSKTSLTPLRPNMWVLCKEACLKDGRPCFGSLFQVRNLGYKKSGEKIPSGPCLYDLLGTEIVRGKGKKISNVTTNWADALMAKIASSPKQGWSPNLGVPEILIMHCQCIYQSGGMWSAHPAEDLGFSIITYHIISDSSLKSLNNPDGCSKPLALFKRFCKVGKSERNGISLKNIGVGANIDELGLPGFIKGFNGKPVLVTNSCTVRKDHSLYPRIMECEYDMRQWSYTCRTALSSYVFSRTPHAKMDVGWCIEGKTDDELPEQMLCCAAADNIDVFARPFIEGR